MYVFVKILIEETVFIPLQVRNEKRKKSGQVIIVIMKFKRNVNVYSFNVPFVSRMHTITQILPAIPIYQLLLPIT